MVGAARFELATYCSQSSRATRLRYAPTGTRMPQIGDLRTVTIPSVAPFATAARQAASRVCDPEAAGYSRRHRPCPATPRPRASPTQHVRSRL